MHGRVDERLRVRATLPALKALVDNGYVGREDGKSFALSYRFLRTLEHRIQLFNLRRTHVLPDNEEDLRRLGRSLGYAEPVNGAAQHLAAHRPAGTPAARAAVLLPAAGRGGPDPDRTELRLTTDAALDRLKALGYADPTAALRHIAALSQGVTRQAEIQRQLLPAMLGWFADAPNPDHGLLAFRQVSEALGTTPVVPAGAARRGGDGRAAGPDPGLQPVRGAAADPGAADRADAGRRSPSCGRGRWADLQAEMHAAAQPAGRHRGRGGGDPGDPAPGAVPGRGR